MAVVTPLLITLLLGIIEYGRRLMVHQTLVQAAREGCRTAVLQGATTSEIEGRVQAYMTAAGLPTYQISITRATTNNPIESVEVTVNRVDVTLFGSFFGSTAGVLRSSCSMRKEGSV
jgi:Flp pilus assembly protein TadG